MLSDTEHRAVVGFIYREARLADEARYAEWLALWTDDGVYWVPATTDPGADPDKHISHIYDNRGRIETRIKIMDMLAAQRMPALVYHLPWPGIGHFAKQGDGFRYVAEPMRLVL